MNLITSLATNIRALTMEDPTQPLQPYSVMMDMLGMTMADAGVLVNEKTAMQQPTVFACVRVKSQGLSSLPLVVYRRQGNGKSEAVDHKLYPILRYRPNQQMTSMAWREGVEAQRQLWGNAYTEIQRDRAQRVVALWPLPSDKTNPDRKAGALRYVTTATANGAEREIDPENMLHVPGLAYDGLTGISPVQLNKQTIARAIAMSRYGSLLFSNAVRPSGAFVYKGGELGEEARENLRKTLQSAASGQNAMRPLLLENDLDWKSMSYPPNEAQFVEAMSQIVADIARGWGVPLHMIQELSRATNNNIEQQALEFVMHGLRPDAIKWEQEINFKLFGNGEFFCEHSMKDLLRGDFKTRMEGWATLFQTGAISPNIILETEGWNPIPAKQGGDLHFVQMNMIPLESQQKTLETAPSAPDSGTPNDPSSPDGSDANAAIRRERVQNACLDLFCDAVRRTINRADRNKLAVTRTWQPIMRTAAGMVSLCAAGAQQVSASLEEFSDSLAADVCGRAQAWKVEEAEAIAEQEFSAAYELLCQHILGDGQ